MPFARGGAEIFTDELVGELRRAGPRGRPRQRAVQVVSGRARADAGVPLAAARPGGGGRAAGRPRRRHEVPLVRRPPPGEARLARAPVPAGLRARPAPSSASSASRRRTGRCGGRCRSSTAWRSARRRRLFATSRNVAERLERSTGLAAEVLPHPPQDARLPLRRLRRLRALGEPARPREADRPAARGGGARAGARGRDRERRPRPRAARAARPRARARRPRALHGPGRRRASSPTSTPAASPTFYAPVDEDFGMGPFESFLAEKPVITTIDAGGPLDVVSDARTGLVVAPEPGEIARARGLAARPPRRGGRARPRRKGGRGRGDVGSRDREAPRREGRVVQPDAARAVGDRRLLGAARARAAAAARRRRRPARQQARLRAAPISASTTSATTRPRTAGSSTRCAAGRASSSCTTSSSTTSSPG